MYQNNDWFAGPAKWKEELESIGAFSNPEMLLRDPVRCHHLNVWLVNEFFKVASPREQMLNCVVGHGAQNEVFAWNIAYLIHKIQATDDPNHHYYRAYTESIEAPLGLSSNIRYPQLSQTTYGFKATSLDPGSTALLVTSVLTPDTRLIASIVAIDQTPAKFLPYVLTYMNLTGSSKTHGLNIISVVNGPQSCRSR